MLASNPVPAVIFMNACSHWNALKVVTDQARTSDQEGSVAARSLLAGSALEMAFKAVLATSGWSFEALDKIGRDLQACRVAALDCGLVPRLSDETSALVATIRLTHLAPCETTAHQLAASINLDNAVPVVGSLIVDIGEQFASIAADFG